MKTSKSDPLQVGWAFAHGVARLGMTMAPGKKAWSRLGGYWWNRDLTEDLRRLRAEGTDVLVCLLEDQELLELGIPDLTREAKRSGMVVRRLRIADAGTPRNIAATRSLVRTIAAWIRDGKTVVVHCAGGLGRSGTICGCAMVELGLSPGDTLAALRRARGPGCPETEAQRRFVRTWRRTP